MPFTGQCTAVMLTVSTAVKIILVEWELWQNSVLHVILNNLKCELCNCVWHQYCCNNRHVVFFSFFTV